MFFCFLLLFAEWSLQNLLHIWPQHWEWVLPVAWHVVDKWHLHSCCDFFHDRIKLMLLTLLMNPLKIALHVMNSRRRLSNVWVTGSRGCVGLCLAVYVRVLRWLIRCLSECVSQRKQEFISEFVTAKWKTQSLPCKINGAAVIKKIVCWSIKCQILVFSVRSARR